jgi:hypothetical protein
MEIVAGDEATSRLMVQNVRHPGLSHVYGEFLSDVSDSQIYVREEPQLGGVTFQQLAYAFPEAVLLGVVRPQGEDFRALLNPPDTCGWRRTTASRCWPRAIGTRRRLR